MNEAQFLEIVDAAKLAHPSWFLAMNDAEPHATEEQISSSEDRLGSRYPEEYKFFLRHFGGGYFAFANVFSVYPSSDWNINSVNERYGLPSSFVAVSDDETGGYYGFRRDGDTLSREVFYIDPAEQDMPEKVYDSLFEFLHDVALSRH